MSGILLACGNTFGGTGGGGGGGSGVALSAVISEGESASDFDNGAWNFASNTCVASGGTAPYSYSWAWSGTSGGTFAFASASNIATVVPRVSAVGANVLANGLLTCTVTDAAATVVASNSAFYTFTNIV